MFLPRKTGDKSFRTEMMGKGMIVDFEKSGGVIGIEITVPEHIMRKNAHAPVAPSFTAARPLEFNSEFVVGSCLGLAMPQRNADAKRPGMHSNAKRWNEADQAARTWPK